MSKRVWWPAEEADPGEVFTPGRDSASVRVIGIKMRGRHTVNTMPKAAALFVALVLAAPAWAQAPALPSSPQVINLIDVAEPGADPEGDRKIPRRSCQNREPDHL